MQHFRPSFGTFNTQSTRNSYTFCIFVPETFQLKYVFVMSIEEKKERMARNYAINSKKTPRTRSAAFAVAHAGAITITDPKLKERLTTYVD